MMETVCFITSLLLICTAHLVRIFRWRLFIEIYEKPHNRNLFQALSAGYLVSYFIPLKMGDLVRAWISGRRMRSGKALSFSTVIVDRYLDIVSVGMIFVVLSIRKDGETYIGQTARFYMIWMLSLLSLMFAIYAVRGMVKKGIRVLAGIFCDHIETVILSFAWALIWNFKDIFQKINKIKLLCATVGMWFLYLASYFFYAAYLICCGDRVTWVDVFVTLFAQNGVRSSTGMATISVASHPVSMIIYMLFPVLFLFALSLLVRNQEMEDGEGTAYLNLFPHLDSVERLSFLESYFSDRNKEYTANYLKINQGISIIRDYSAGSNATTMLCIDGERTFFRKYAFGSDGEKLYEQILWLEENRDRIALPEIIRHEKTNLYCYYDMPYSSNHVGLFEYVHSMPVKQGWEMIQRVLESLEHTIYDIDVTPADRETIHRYIDGKVKKNLDQIKSAKRIRNLQQYETVYINGIVYDNLPAYEKFLCEEYLQKVFQKDTYAVIHGDLTIENIICTRDDRGKDDFYIIDPNTGNIHNSPNLDYGKLLQSIHGGYEFLMTTKNVKVVENRIDFIFTRSSAYAELHRLLRSYMQQQFERDRIKSIYFHEIIHWLRLMPYKIEKDANRAVLFYAGMLMVMNDVIHMFGNDGTGD